MFRTPPSWTPHWQSRDIDEIASRWAAMGVHRRQAVGRGPLDYRAAIVALDKGGFGWVQCNLGQRVDATPAVPLVHLPLSTTHSYRIGRRAMEAAPGRAVFLQPGVPYETAFHSGRAFAIQLDRIRFEQALASLVPGGPPNERLRSREVAISPPQEAALARIVGAAGGGPPAGPLAMRLERQLEDWLATALIADLPRITPGWAAAARLARVEEWVDDHLEEPIGLGQLCEVAGIDARGLQKSFLFRRGMTPMRWLRSRRLVAARQRLLQARQGETVTAIAVHCGFTQLGRFAAEYRRRYGERPSETMRAATGR